MRVIANAGEQHVSAIEALMQYQLQRLSHQEGVSDNANAGIKLLYQSIIHQVHIYTMALVTSE